MLAKCEDVLWEEVAGQGSNDVLLGTLAPVVAVFGQGDRIGFAADEQRSEIERAGVGFVEVLDTDLPGTIALEVARQLAAP